MDFGQDPETLRSQKFARKRDKEPEEESLIKPLPRNHGWFGQDFGFLAPFPVVGLGQIRVSEP
jgi:hypothetical protein